MVAEFQQRDQTALGFQFLKKAAPVTAQPEEKPIGKKGRWINAITGALSIAAIAVGAWMPSLPARRLSEPPAVQESTLLDQLGSEKYAKFELEYQRDRTAQLLAKAEGDAADAAELKRSAINLEEEAKSMHLVAWRSVVDDDLDYEPGQPIKVTTKAKVECTEAVHGTNVEIEYPNKQYRAATIGPVAECFSGTHLAGSRIATAGEQTVSVADR